ncbi:hypothetical protein TKK_0014004 [Trichogramma kaykai]|uniref:H15 domain-containing protein n=1 Tax=Trichogramma kaykai TaxID=54128 RepID=A0ABD2WGH7_9HYME
MKRPGGDRPRRRFPSSMPPWNGRPEAGIPATTTTGAHRDAGASFDELVRYVRDRMRTTEARAAWSVEQVLRAGIAFRKIERLANGRYRLAQANPPGLACVIREMRTSDDSCCSSD